MMLTIPYLRRVALTLFLFLLSSTKAKIKDGKQRNIKIVNESGHRVEIYWIHWNGEASLMSPHILSGTTYILDSFASHNFEARELPHVKTNKCVHEECKKGYFRVNHNFNQVITIEPGMVIVHADDKSVARDKAVEIIKECKTMALKESTGTSKGKTEIINDLAACVERNVMDTLETLREEIAIQTDIRRGMAELFENYTCNDEQVETSDEISIELWESYEKTWHQVKVLHDRPSSKIHIVQQFITEEECRAMEQEAVVDDADSMDKQVKVPWQETKHPIATLSQRVYDYTNHVLGLDITKDGQEDLMLYFGDGYKPRCDGSCHGDLHIPGNRVATMIMYCQTADKGGATNFGNAGIHVKPTKGDAVFINYMNPDDKGTDYGFTQHSGCPVLLGEQKIVMQWVRVGVDKEHQWNSFDSPALSEQVPEEEVVSGGREK